jgi:hypothetical protein
LRASGRIFARRNLALRYIGRHVPKNNEVLIKVHFAGVNPADWKFRASFPRSPKLPNRTPLKKAVRQVRRVLVPRVFDHFTMISIRPNLPLASQVTHTPRRIDFPH